MNLNSYKVLLEKRTESLKEKLSRRYCPNRKSLSEQEVAELQNEIDFNEGLVKEISTIEYSHAIPLTAHEKITAELFDTYKRKNHDYGDSFTESLNEFGLVAGLVRVGDKVNRLKTLTKNEQQVSDESLRDTILDASNYLIMMAMWLDNK